MPLNTPASERWIIVDDNATGKEPLEEKIKWQPTTSFSSKYFSEDNIAGHPLSMTFRKESVSAHHPSNMASDGSPDHGTDPDDDDDPPLA